MRIKKAFFIVYRDRDGGWYKVMQNGICRADFRSHAEAQEYIASRPT